MLVKELKKNGLQVELKVNIPAKDVTEKLNQDHGFPISIIFVLYNVGGLINLQALRLVSPIFYYLYHIFPG